MEFDTMNASPWIRCRNIPESQRDGIDRRGRFIWALSRSFQQRDAVALRLTWWTTINPGLTSRVIDFDGGQNCIKTIRSGRFSDPAAHPSPGRRKHSSDGQRPSVQIDGTSRLLDLHKLQMVCGIHNKTPRTETNFGRGDLYQFSAA